MAGDNIDTILKEMQNEIHAGALICVGNSKDIMSLQNWQKRQNGTLCKIEKHLVKIEAKLNTLQVEDISSLRLELAKGKPTWAVTFILAGLMSITVGAIVFALKTVGGI